MRLPTLTAAALLVAASMAQSPTPQPPFPQGRNGPRLGFGMASQSTGGLFQNGTDLLIGPYAGWHWEAPVHWQMSIMPELLWVTKGSVVRNPAQGVRERNTFRYLELPILLKMSTDKQQDGLFLLAGPSVGYFVTGRYQRWLNGEKDTDIKYDLSNTERRFQLSVLLGMGMEGERWAFDVRAQTSITPFEELIKVQNVVYALTVAYRMGGKKAEPPETEE